MSEKDPLDDDLLRELGLEPREPEEDDEALAEDEAASYEEPAPESVPTDEEEIPAPRTRGRQVVQETPASRRATPDDEFLSNTRHLVKDMPIQVVAVLGKKTMTLSEVLELKAGEVVDLRKLPQEMVDLVANGRLIARGELVLVDGKVGIQIKKVVAS